MRYPTEIATRGDVGTNVNELFHRALAASVKPDTEKAQRLVNRQYTGPFRLWYGNEQYLGHDFRVQGLPAPGQPDRTVWIARYGQYGHYMGYWIYLPNANKCWQAVNANGPLRYWNEDGQASGPPEDWELFLFRNVDVDRGIVRVMNLWGRHVRFSGGASFVCDADEAGGDLFIVE